MPPNQNSETDNDQVADTDPHISSEPVNCMLEESENYINQCTGRPFGKIGRNIMSYGCRKDRFTLGQIQRIRQYLASFNNPLGSSNLLNPINSSDTPLANSCLPSFTPKTDGSSMLRGVATVQLANLYRQSPLYATPNYDNQSCTQIVRVTKGQTYSLIIAGLGSYGKAYIDHNNDGTFNEDDELLIAFSSPNDGFLSTQSQSITIPTEALPNRRLRMRVVYDNGSTPPSARNLPGHPTQGAGEIEEYSVIVDEPACYSVRNGSWTDQTIWSCGRCQR